MQKTNASLLMLKGLSAKDLAAIEQVLSRLNISLSEAHAQLAMLQEYRVGYKDSHNIQLTSGLSMSAIKNFNNFMVNLDEAIRGQEGVVSQIEVNILKSKTMWYEFNKKSLTYDVLLRKHEQKIVKVEARYEQKSTDDFSSRRKV